MDGSWQDDAVSTGGQVKLDLPFERHKPSSLI